MGKDDGRGLGKESEGHVEYLAEIPGSPEDLHLPCYHFATTCLHPDTRAGIPHSVRTLRWSPRCGEGNAAAPDEPLPFKEDEQWE